MRPQLPFRHVVLILLVIGLSRPAWGTWLNCEIKGYEKAIFDGLQEKSDQGESSRTLFEHLNNETSKPQWTERLPGIKFEGWGWVTRRNRVRRDNYSNITLPSSSGAVQSATIRLKKFPGFPAKDLRFSVMLTESTRGYAGVNLELTDWVNKFTTTGSAVLNLYDMAPVSISLNRLDGGLLNDNKLGRILMLCTPSEKVEQTSELIER